MHTDEDAVASQPDVALDSVSTVFEGPAVRRKGVLGLNDRCATMSHHRGALAHIVNSDTGSYDAALATPGTYYRAWDDDPRRAGAAS